jgi:hypothetical protein
MRKPITLSTVWIICFIVLIATNRIALGQAGSTGGTIGKTDKVGVRNPLNFCRLDQHARKAQLAAPSS